METLLLLFVSATVSYHLPLGLLKSECYVESHHNVMAIHHDDGNGDSLGVCQVKLNTARMLGFKGTARQLMIPATNVHYAALYLRKQLNRYGQNVPMAVSAYNAGKYRTGNYPYVSKVMKAWRDQK